MATDPNAFTVDAILCDSATSADGKLYIHGGGWNTMNTPTTPFVQPRTSIGLILGVPFTATNQKHELEITLENQDGDKLALDGESVVEGGPPQVRAGAEFALGRPPLLQPGERQTVPFAVNLDALRFVKPGNYSFVIRVDEVEHNRLEFRVQLVNQVNFGQPAR